jgi:hypothetical protein
MTLRPLLRWCLAIAVGAFSAHKAQGQGATFRGRVLNSQTNAPIVGATIAVTTSGASTRTDSLGDFRLEGLKVGIHRMLVSASGYTRGTLTVALAAREVMERELTLDPLGTPDSAGTERPQALPNVAVSADRPLGRRYADFERRRATGRGQYLTRTDVEAGQYNSLSDAMRPLRGIRWSCGGGSCSVQMARAPMGCDPTYIVDEREDNSFGPQIPIRDIQGIEVYTGASDVPGEFAGVNAGCGVIVIWTTSGREGRRR